VQLDTDLLLFINNHTGPGIFESDPIYELHANEGLVLVPARSIDLRNRHIREQMSNGLYTLTLATVIERPYLTMRLRAGKITRGGLRCPKGVTACQRHRQRGKEAFEFGKESRFIEDDVVARGKHRGNQKVDHLGLGTRETS
jgi:hypothetical protein